MKTLINRITVLSTILILASVFNAGSMVVQSIKVESLGGPLDSSSVLVLVSIKEGEEYLPEKVAADIKTIQKSDKFSNVEAYVENELDGLVVIYKVKAKSRLNSLTIEGAEKVRSRKVRQLLALNKGSYVDDAVLAIAVQKVIKHYHEHLFPSITIDWKINEDKETGLSDVAVIVNEGSRVRIGRINFSGVKAVPVKILRRIMTQKGSNYLSLLTGKGVLDKDAINTDLILIRNYYLSKGYLDVVVKEPEFSTKKGKINVLIPIEEGQLNKIGKVQISGMSLFQKTEIQQILNLNSDAVAGLKEIEQARQRVQDYYSAKGYIGSRVDYSMSATSPGIIDLSYTISEGVQAYVGDINIRGNTITRDKVIRRELIVSPGDKFNETRVKRSEKRLWNLGYFSQVRSSRKLSDEAGYYDVTFDVEERPTGQFMVGAGFSSVDNLVGFVELSLGNFDIANWPRFTGGGQKLKLRTQLGTERNDLEMSFTEPWFLNRKLALGVDFFQHERRFLSDDYDQKNDGGSISLSKALGGYHRLTFKYAFESIDVFNLSETVSDQISVEAGSRSKSSLTLSLNHDNSTGTET